MPHDILHGWGRKREIVHPPQAAVVGAESDKTRCGRAMQISAGGIRAVAPAQALTRPLLRSLTLVRSSLSPHLMIG
jgi:hypothetical protein